MNTQERATKQYKGTICRGSIQLGTACGYCERCMDELAKMNSGNPNGQIGGLGAISPQAPALSGWICPKCGGGNAPSSLRCPCSPLPPMISTC